MKVAISLPDDIYEDLEAVRADQDLSRSELYTMALRQFLQRRRDDDITRRMNAVYAHEDSSLEPEWLKAQIAALEPEEWE